MTQLPTDPKELTFDSGQNIIKFGGRCVDIKWADKQQENRNVNMEFQFLDVQVHESATPWTFPQYSFQVPYALQGPRWKALTESIKAIKSKGWAIGGMVGMWVELEWKGGIKGTSRDASGNWIDIEMEAWVVLSISDTQGEVEVSEVSADTLPIAKEQSLTRDELLFELAVGEDDPGFQRKAMQDVRIKTGNQYPELFNELMSSGAGVLAELISLGRLRVVDGKYEGIDLPW